MDVVYINKILSTTSIRFKAYLNKDPYIFFVKAGQSTLDTDNNLVITDCIEDTTFTLPSSSVIFDIQGRDEVFPTIDENYQDFVVQNRQKIDRNNEVFEKEFNNYKLLAEGIQKNSENFQVLKQHRPEKTINVINRLGITDLANYYAGGEKAANVLRARSLDLLKSSSLNAKQNLNAEREQLIAKGDTESVEEIDIILDMIDIEVNSTTFNTVSCIEDIYTQWPPILLPVPIERHGLFFT